MTAHPADSALFGHLWGTPEVHRLFSDKGRVQRWLEILAALAEAQADVGLVPRHAAETIRAYADVELVDINRVGELNRAAGHSTLGLIRVLREILPDDAAEWVYYGATVQDLTDSWTALVIKDVADIIANDLVHIRKTVIGLAKKHRNTPMCGRTHGQPGLPITFGYKAAVWASELGRHLDRIAEGRPRWQVAQLGGALGTMEFWGDSAIELLTAYAKRLGLQPPDIPWLTARDRVAEFVTDLAMITATLGKIGNEIYQLQRPEIGEVGEPFTEGQVGSITMPHKRNPELSEHLCTLASIVRAQAGTAVEAMVTEHERDGRAWKTEWVTLPEACLGAATALKIASKLLDGLQVNTGKMAANLAARGGYLQSEPVLRALSDKLGKHTAHEVVYAATMRGIEAGQDFRTALRNDSRLDIIDDSTLDALLEPAAALGACGAFVDRVVDD
jgi:adenylosuccinate lyase